MVVLRRPRDKGLGALAGSAAGVNNIRVAASFFPVERALLETDR